MVGRSFWRTGLGVLIRTIVVEGGDAESDCLIQYLKLLFEGTGSTKINEDANRLVKEIVMRQRASTVHKYVWLWCQAVIKHLAETFHRKEIPIHTTLPTSKEFVVGYFQPCQESVDTEVGDNGLDLAAMASKADWVLLAHTDWGMLAAEDMILQTWNLLGAASPQELWQSDLLPVWEVCQDIQRCEGRFFFVLALVKNRAALVIIIEPDEYGFWKFPRTAADYRPYYKLIHNLHDIYVLSSTVKSPKGVRYHVRRLVNKRSVEKTHFELKRRKGFRGPHNFVPSENIPHSQMGTKLLWVDEPSVPLTKFHVKRAFKGISTDTMDKLILKLGVEASMLDCTEEGAFETEEQYALALMFALESNITLLEAQLALQERRVQRRGDSAGLRALMQDDVLRDLLVREDLGVVKDMLEKDERDEEVAEEARLQAKKHVHAAFKKARGQANYKEANDEYVANTTDRRVFRPLVTGDNDLVILGKLRAPWPVRTIKDARAGHYVITLHGVYIKSYAWTQIRTPKLALQMILNRSWYTSRKHLGINPSLATMEAIEGILDLDIPGLNRDGEYDEE
jgi:hypothetical protein